jgi:hypothetical protein
VYHYPAHAPNCQKKFISSDDFLIYTQDIVFSSRFISFASLEADSKIVKQKTMNENPFEFLFQISFSLSRSKLKFY